MEKYGFASSQFSSAYLTFLASIHSHTQLKTYKEASSDPQWQQTMAEKLAALNKTHTWDLVCLPPGKSTISCKWVFKIKTKADGTIEIHKARLVVKGYNLIMKRLLLWLP